MKNIRIICLLLCLIMVLQFAAVPAFATETEESTTTQETTETTETTEATEPPVLINPYPIPDNLTGDASVTNGCVSIDGQKALTSQSGLLRTTKGAILFEMNTGTLLYAKNPDEKMYPASLTKVMTCLVALEKGDLDEIVTVSESAISDIDPDGSSANLVVDEQISFRDLLYCLMVESANDAGAVIAENVAGSQEAFCELMNQKAAELGCTGTHFSNPHGLHADDHYTTPRDMAKIMLEALEYSEFHDLYSTSFYKVPATNLSRERELYTTNYLIGNELIDYYYDDRFIGGKTGYTTPAGRCLIGTAEDEDSDFSLLIVILGAEETVAEDGYTILRYGNFEESWALADYGFEEFAPAELYTRGQSMGSFPVAGGENSVVGEPCDERSVILPADFKNIDITFKADALAEGLTAPVRVGDVIGTLRVWYQDICVAQTDMLSLSVSKKDNMSSIFSGGVITEEEDRKITSSVRTGVRIFLLLVVIVLALSLIVAIRNAYIGHKRRQRRRNRRRSR